MKPGLMMWSYERTQEPWMLRRKDEVRDGYALAASSSRAANARSIFILGVIFGSP